MNKTKEVFLFFGLMSLFVGCTDNSRNQQYFQPGEIWKDTDGEQINAHGGGVLFHQGKYYWYGEYKISGKAGNKAMVGVSCYSSVNLYDWQNEGIVLSVSKEKKHLLQAGCIIERPKVIYNARTGKFVMWFHHELKGEDYRSAMTGVAVSNSALGPFDYKYSCNPNKMNIPQNMLIEEYDLLEEIAEETKPADISDEELKHGALMKRDLEKGQMSRDMTLFVDHDNTAYHIHASEENSTLHISKLSEDYTEFTGEYIRVQPGEFNEAPALFARGDKYFMITSGCTDRAPNAGRLLVADSIFGEWEYAGNPFRGENSEISFNSQSTYVIEVMDRKDSYIFMGDRWNPDNAIDGRYVWLPIRFDEKGLPYLKWHEKWSLNEV